MISNESRRRNEEHGMKNAWNDAFSIESYEGDMGDLEEVGRQQSRIQKDKEFVFYKDKNGAFWYRVEFLTDHGRISEYEHIFGKKPEKRRRKTS